MFFCGLCFFMYEAKIFLIMKSSGRGWRVSIYKSMLLSTNHLLCLQKQTTAGCGMKQPHEFGLCHLITKPQLKRLPEQVFLWLILQHACCTTSCKVVNMQRFEFFSVVVLFCKLFGWLYQDMLKTTVSSSRSELSVYHLSHVDKFLLSF